MCTKWVGIIVLALAQQGLAQVPKKSEQQYTFTDPQQEQQQLSFDCICDNHFLLKYILDNIS